jgi:DNA-directed RNA polymerase subunit alpha
MSAKDAVSYASDNLMRHFNSFCLSENYGSFNNFHNNTEDFSSCGDPSIEELNLSSRASNSLKRAGIERLSQLKKMSFDEISGIRNLGKKSCEEVVTVLKGFGWKDERPKKNQKF